MVAAWMSAETGVGPSMASGSHVCSGSCADFASPPISSRPQIQLIVDVSTPSCAAGAEDLDVVDRAELAEDHEDADRHADVADGVHDERLLGGGDRARPLVPEADQQVRRQADHAPADQQHDEVRRQHQDQHREHEQVQVGEVAALLHVAVHVPDRVDVDQEADARHDEQHHGATAGRRGSSCRRGTCRTAATSRRRRGSTRDLLVRGRAGDEHDHAERERGQHRDDRRSSARRGAERARRANPSSAISTQPASGAAYASQASCEILSAVQLHQLRRCRASSCGAPSRRSARARPRPRRRRRPSRRARTPGRRRPPT